MLTGLIVQFNANATRNAYSTAIRLTTGSVPGMPEQTGHTAVFGGAETESTTAQLQNIFDFVCSSAWTSRPITGSYSNLFITTYAVREKIPKIRGRTVQPVPLFSGFFYSTA